MSWSSFLSLLDFPPISYMHSSPPQFMLHAPTISSSLIATTIRT
jgi:hypothetical protein